MKQEKAEYAISASWLFFSSWSCLSFESRSLLPASLCCLNQGPHWTTVIHMLTIAYMLFAKVSSAELWPHHTYFPTACYLYHRKACLDKKKKNSVMSMKFIMFSRTGFIYSFERHKNNSILIFDSISLTIIRNKISKYKWCMLAKHQLHIHYWADGEPTFF